MFVRFICEHNYRCEGEGALLYARTFSEGFESQAAEEIFSAIANDIIMEQYCG